MNVIDRLTRAHETPGRLYLELHQRGLTTIYTTGDFHFL